MSSSPKLTGVSAFQYEEPGTLTANPAGTGRLDGHTNPHAGPLNTEELELKLAAARAEGIREGLQQAQQSSEKDLTAERAKIAETIRHFQLKTSEYYAKAEIEMVHLSLAIAAKILHREAQVDRMLVAALVKVAMEKLQHGTSPRSGFGRKKWPIGTATLREIPPERFALKSGRSLR